MKKYFYYAVQVVILLVVFMACKKLTTDAFLEHPVLKAPLNIAVVNDDDQLPVVGVKVIISRKTSPKDEYVRVDTVRTNEKGQINGYMLPYPNYLKIEVDTTYYHKGEQMLEFVTENGVNVMLHTTPKYGMAPLSIGVNNTTTDLPIPGLALSISSRAPEKTEWLSTGPENADATGKLMVSLPYPNEVRVAVADTIRYFPDTVVTNLKNVRGEAVALKTELKPLTVPLEVTLLDKDNQNPLANAEIAVLLKLTGETDFKDINLVGITNNDGKVILNAPYSGEVMVKTNDDIYYLPDSYITRLAYEKNRKITLLSKLLNPLVPVELSVFSAVYGMNNKRAAFGTNVKVSFRKKGQTVFTNLLTSAIAANGKLTMSVPLGDEFKFEVIGNDQFADKTITYTNVGFTLKAIDFALDLRPAKYPEPVLTNLQVGTLALNNSLSVTKPQDIAVDKLGNRYLTETSGHRIIRVDRFGNTTVLAGAGTLGFQDGDGVTAKFNGPWGLAIDRDGNLYVSDNVSSGSTSNRIRKITIDATYKTTVSTIAGSATAGGTNGVGTAASFNRPAGLCYDEARNCLYVAEWSGHRVRKIDLATNTVSLIAGTGTAGTPTGGVGAGAVFNFPWGVKLSADGTSLYVSCWTGNSISKIRLADNNVTILGIGKTNMGSPRGIYLSPSNQLFLSNTTGNYISKMQTEVEGNLSTFTRVTSTGTAGNIDGAANIARFDGPVGITYDPYTGMFYIADGDRTNNKIRTMKSSDIQ
jgi:DNA-binding beta-propeller fold protein YncE